MAALSVATDPIRDIGCIKYYCTFTIEDWRDYLKQEERSPLEERSLLVGRLQTGELSWKLKLDCNLDPARESEWAGPGLTVELESELVPSKMVMVRCSLLGQENAQCRMFWHGGETRAHHMDIPVEDVLATLELDELKIHIQLNVRDLPNFDLHGRAHLMAMGLIPIGNDDLTKAKGKPKD